MECQAVQSSRAMGRDNVMTPKAVQDTPPGIERVQIELLRRAGPVRRAALACAMTATATILSRRAIQRAHPEWNDHDVNLFWLEVHYGRDLAAKVRHYMEARSHV